ncbi:MAG TPA: thiamine pyrophosphate-dependent dehydrogenase E1 component subunit alpha [Conexibacter sp.]|nr:thiamine pyrophosphate-dependent dehydrogenase E1 component subunit alpha [Conexibacter sp.]
MSTAVTAPEPRLPHEVLPASEAAKGAREVPAELALELYRLMVLIRDVEDAVQPLYNAGEIHGTTHLCTGEEAIGVGICTLLDPQRDRVASTYRGHGHAIALGSSAQGLLDELLGKATGTGGGRAGSMNVIDLEHGLLGCFGIVGGSMAAATGAALALKGTGAIAVAFFGDGTANQGYFHECLNFAQVHRLPVLFVCENNLYGEFTPFEAITAGAISARPDVMGIPNARINGNDLWDVRDCAGRFIDEIRAGGGPRFLEAITYRFGGHSRSDPGAYRPDGELDAWKQYDPLVLERRHLVDELGVDAAVVDAIDQDVAAEVEAMVERGRAAAWPTPDPDLTEFAP